MIVGPDYVYLEVPRTGSSSMREYLQKHEQGTSIGAQHSVRIQPRHLQKRIWAVTRHPLDRLVSLFFQQSPYLLDMRARKRLTPEIVLHDWEHFVKHWWPRVRPGRKRQGPYKFQTAVGVVGFLKGAPRWPDEILRFEEMGTRFPKMPHINRSPRIVPRADFWKVPGIVEAALDPRTIDPEDFDEFGYDRTPP